MDQGVAGTVILIITGLVTYAGLTRSTYQEKYKFDVDRILIDKEYYRLISSGFVHANWIHFAFNMGALLSFSYSLEIIFGIVNFVMTYFFSMLGGSLFSLLIHRNHGDYTAVGASGGVSGVIAASILLFPLSEIGFVILPIGIKSWIFGLLLVAISIVGIKSQSDNIGHEAHLGGILTGVTATLFIDPIAVYTNWWVLLILIIPIIWFLYMIYTRPEILLTNNWGISKPKVKLAKSQDSRVDDILEKIKAEGFQSLTKKEKELLKRYSDTE
ncbi:rhomboid family protein [Lewinella sp. IMCC34183]|uniref:rhomboid family protein n=1 Tax=Lewinella sp. IMCC34183 TaxID=2248762 RepID=UPI000E24CB98|nr:rhomboid family intramembrane serine protease [Lewinella sp. IMCC34183]